MEIGHLSSVRVEKDSSMILHRFSTNPFFMSQAPSLIMSTWFLQVLSIFHGNCRVSWPLSHCTASCRHSDESFLGSGNQSNQSFPTCTVFSKNLLISLILWFLLSCFICHCVVTLYCHFTEISGKKINSQYLINSLEFF